MKIFPLETVPWANKWVNSKKGESTPNNPLKGPMCKGRGTLGTSWERFEKAPGGK